MSAFDGYSRDQLRETYAQAWRKHHERLPLTPLESMLVDVIALHPEYAVAVQSKAAAVDFEASSQDIENPFLHMGLHMAVREQISVDRPPGVRDLHRELQARFGHEHDAEHVLMEALGETLWEAQRSGRVPDEQAYMRNARHRLKR